MTVKNKSPFVSIKDTSPFVSDQSPFVSIPQNHLNIYLHLGSLLARRETGYSRAEAVSISLFCRVFFSLLFYLFDGRRCFCLVILFLSFYFCFVCNFSKESSKPEAIWIVEGFIARKQLLYLRIVVYV